MFREEEKIFKYKNIYKFQTKNKINRINSLKFKEGTIYDSGKIACFTLANEY